MEESLRVVRITEFTDKQVHNLRHGQKKHVLRQGIGVAVVEGMQTMGLVQVVAGPPLVTNDTGTVEMGLVEVERNSCYVHDREIVGYPD